MLWVLLGIVVIVVIWAFISAYNGKTEVKSATTYAPPMDPIEYEKPELPKAGRWDEAAKTSVSKNFGKGGNPTGSSKDSAGIAVSSYDEDIAWMKKARAFEPRATKLDLDQDVEEAGDTV